MQKSAEKSQKLKEANKQQNFNTGIKDFDFWLSEVMPRISPPVARRCLVTWGDRSVSEPKTMRSRALLMYLLAKIFIIAWEPSDVRDSGGREGRNIWRRVSLFLMALGSLLQRECS